MKKTLLLTATLLIGAYALVQSLAQVNAQSSPSFRLSPASREYAPGSAVTLNVQMSTGSQEATAYVVAIDVTGSSVPSNLAVNSQPPSGMTTQGAQVANVSGGKQVQLEVTGGAGSGTVNTNNAYQTIATLTFAAPNNGSVDFDLNSSISAIYTVDSGNVMSGSFSENYTFESAPTCTPSAPNISSLTPKGTVAETNSVQLAVEVGSYGENCGEGSPQGSIFLNGDQVFEFNSAQSNITHTINVTPGTTYNWSAMVSNGALEDTEEATFTVSQSEPSVPTGMTVHIRLQGITIDAPPQNLDITLNQGGSTRYQFDQVPASTGDAESVVSAYTATVEGLSPGTYQVCIKAKSHLQKCFAGITLSEGMNSIDLTKGEFESVELRAGDVNGDNDINLTDWGALLQCYNYFSNPLNSDGSINVHGTNQVCTNNGRPLDVNHDGDLTLTDISLFIVNYDDLHNYGDE